MREVAVVAHDGHGELPVEEHVGHVFRIRDTGERGIRSADLDEGDTWSEAFPLLAGDYGVDATFLL
jgi:hypothetical protein